jgi:hypothetical protein
MALCSGRGAIVVDARIRVRFDAGTQKDVEAVLKIAALKSVT